MISCTHLSPNLALKSLIQPEWAYRTESYRTVHSPPRFGSARARYYRARAEHTPCTVRYDLFCERDMAIRYGSINVRYGLMNVRFGSRMLGAPRGDRKTCLA